MTLPCPIIIPVFNIVQQEKRLEWVQYYSKIVSVTKFLSEGTFLEEPKVWSAVLEMKC